MLILLVVCVGGRQNYENSGEGDHNKLGGVDIHGSSLNWGVIAEICSSPKCSVNVSSTG